MCDVPVSKQVSTRDAARAAQGRIEGLRQASGIDVVQDGIGAGVTSPVQGSLVAPNVSERSLEPGHNPESVCLLFECARTIFEQSATLQDEIDACWVGWVRCIKPNIDQRGRRGRLRRPALCVQEFGKQVGAIGQVIGAKSREAETLKGVGCVEIPVVVEAIAIAVVYLEGIAVAAEGLIEVHSGRSGQDCSIGHDIAGWQCASSANGR